MSWRRTTLGELCAEGGGDIQTGPFGSQLHASDYVASGVPAVMPTNIGENVIDPAGIAHISVTDTERLARYQLRAGDIVYSRRGDVEKRAFVRPENDGWLCGTGCLRVRLGPTATCDPLFLSYLLGGEDSRDWVVRHAVGATMPNLNTSILAALPVSIPDPMTQRAIAEVLGALDDKIAANAGLTGLVRARLDALYIGSLTSGSSTHPLDSLVAFHNRKRVPLSARERELRPGKVPYYGASGMFGFVDVPLFDEPLTLVGEDGSVITEDGRPVVQYIWGPAWVNNHAHALTGSAISTELLTVALGRSDVRHLVTGAVQPKLSMGKLKTLEVELPGGEARSELERSCADGMALLRATTAESRTLNTLRDTLLPHLMSGRLQVKDAERRVEAAV